jgi:xanthine dehydrogenase FAD-binding subunit
MEEFIIPKSLNEVLRIISEMDVEPFAGGTDIMVKYRYDKPAKPFLFIGDLKELRYVKDDGEYIRIGSSTTYSELLENRNIDKIFKEIIKKIASPSIRNRGTIGGNICNASPAADTLPFLYGMDCEVQIVSINNSRFIPIKDFIISPKRTLILKNELLKEIRYKKEKFNKYFYRKIGLRNANSLSKLSFFGCARIKKNIIEDIRISMGAVSPVVVREREIEKMLFGLDKKGLNSIKEEIIKRYEDIIHPIDDQRSTAEYRREIVLRILNYFLENIYII